MLVQPYWKHICWYNHVGIIYFGATMLEAYLLVKKCWKHICWCTHCRGAVTATEQDMGHKQNPNSMEDWTAG